MSQDHLSVDEAAIELGVSRATVWKWLRRHEIQTFRALGDRRTLISRSDIARLREPVPIDPPKKAAA